MIEVRDIPRKWTYSKLNAKNKKGKPAFPVGKKDLELLTEESHSVLY